MAHISAHISAYFDCLSPAQLEGPQGQPGLYVAQWPPTLIPDITSDLISSPRVHQGPQGYGI